MRFSGIAHTPLNLSRPPSSRASCSFTFELVFGGVVTKLTDAFGESGFERGGGWRHQVAIGCAAVPPSMQALYSRPR